MECLPVQATTIASIVASSFAYLAINLVVKRVQVFSSTLLLSLSEKDKSYAVQLYGNEFRTESRIHDWIYVYTMC